MDKRFLTAFITPKEWDVVGYRLKPYSVRKYINLQAVNSPYVNGQAPTPLETIQFLKWCSSDCESIVEIGKPTLLDYVAYAKIRFQPEFHVHVIKCIVNYVKEYSTGPIYRIAKKDKAETLVDRNSIPDLLSLVTVCMAKLGLSEKEAMDSSIGKMTWYAAVIAIIEGADVRLMPESEDPQSEADDLREWEREQAEKLRLAMVNGKIPKRKIKMTSQ